MNRRVWREEAEETDEKKKRIYILCLTALTLGNDKGGSCYVRK
jgi:hypothetical protein